MPVSPRRFLTSRRIHTAFHLHVCTSPRQPQHPISAPSPARRRTPHDSVVPLPSSRTIQNPTHESSAPGRGLADGATEQAPGSAVGSLAPAGTSPSPNPRRCRAPQAPSTGPRFGGPACSRVVVVARDVCPVPPCRGGPVQVLGRVHASTSPLSGVRCPGDRPVSTHPLSNIGVWTSRCPGVGCPRVRVRVRGVCTGDFIERVGAAGSHTARRARVWPSCRIRERHDHRPEPGWLLLRTVWRCSGCVLRLQTATTLRGRRGRSRAESLGRCEPSGLDCDLRLRPRRGRNKR